jgi:hypothetical protein
VNAVPPGDGGVRAPNLQEQRWITFAGTLTPASSLARVDTVTARVVTTVTIVGTLLTGLGLLGASMTTANGAARWLGAAAVIAAALAVACALAAQLLSINRRLNTNDPDAVAAWYVHQMDTRAYPTQWATYLLLAAVVLAGAAAAVALGTAPATDPVVAVTRTLQPATGTSPATATVTIDVTFQGLPPGQAGSVVAQAGRTGPVLASAAATTGSSGTASRTLTVSDVPTRETVIVVAATPTQRCTEPVGPGSNRPALTCQPTRASTFNLPFLPATPTPMLTVTSHPPGP